MTSTYWVEMTLEVSGDTPIEASFASDFVDQLDESHDGQVVYTFSRKTRLLHLSMATVSSEPIEQVACKVVGTVRSAAHELGLHTPGWPEPVAIEDVRIKTLTTEAVVAC